VSLTVTVKLQLVSDGVEQLTVVAPTLKNEPEGGVHVTGTPQLPLVVGGL
jgi:hypothetical protein